jgi:hypothetical protein
MRRFAPGRAVGVIALAFVATLACGGGTSSQASSCQAACRVCTSELCADCSATAGRFRDEFESSLYACVQAGSDASCDTTWTRCLVQAEGAIAAQPRSIDTTYRDACLQKRSDCAAAGTSFADDDCLLSPILEASLVAQAQQCLSQSCATVAACLRPIFQ